MPSRALPAARPPARLRRQVETRACPPPTTHPPSLDNPSPTPRSTRPPAMDHGADEDRIHDSEPEREAAQARKDERRAARRAARAAGAGSSTASSAASGLEDDSDEIQEIDSSRAGVRLQQTTSAYFPRKKKSSGAS